MRVMMPRRSGDRSAFELDLCAHQEETPSISNGEVSHRAGAPALRSTPSALMDMSALTHEADVQIS